MAEPVTLQFLGATGAVTGSKFLIEIGPRRILVDAGMYQGEKVLRDLNWQRLPVDAASIEAVILTHAHADHSAYLPALFDQGFRGDVWCTEGTAKLAEIILLDSAKLQELETEEAIRGGYSRHAAPRPLYSTGDAERAIERFRTVDYDRDIDLDGLTARWTRAGHILGSASVRLQIGDVSVLFSGDLGRADHPILDSRDVPPGARWVLCESTYGDREHPEPEVPYEPTVAAINRTIERGGSVLMPAFAIDRTQTLMYVLARLQREGRIPDVPVIVDGPMSMRALDVYRDMPEEFRADVSIDDFTGLRNFTEARSGQDSRKVRERTEPRIIISSSGMLEGGRVLSHLEQLLPRRENTILISGYQAEGTRGRQLLDGAKHVKIRGAHVRVRAEIAEDRQYSGHADASELVDWLRALDPAPETVFLVHGEPVASTALEARVEEELGLDVVLPSLGEKVLLSERPAADGD